MTKTYSITSKFQVTIPKEIRDQLRLTDKDKVSFSRRGKEVILKKTPTLDEVANEMNAVFAASGQKPLTDEQIKNARYKFHKKGLKW